MPLYKILVVATNEEQALKLIEQGIYNDILEVSMIN